MPISPNSGSKITLQDGQTLVSAFGTSIKYEYEPDGADAIMALVIREIEEGKLNSEETFQLLNNYLKPMLAFNIDHLVLGCTHYPYLIPQIKKILGSQVKIIDSGEAVAKQTKAVLETTNLLAEIPLEKIKHTLYINTNKTVLENIVNDVKVNKQIFEEDF